MQDLGPRIRALRLDQGWTQEDVVTKLQLRGHGTITQPRQAEIEAGRRDITAAELVSYARIFGIPITRLLGEPDFANE